MIIFQDYLFSLLTGYHDPPAGVTLAEEQHYNVYFPGQAIGMAQALYNEIIEYEDGKLYNILLPCCLWHVWDSLVAKTWIYKQKRILCQDRLAHNTSGWWEGCEFDSPCSADWMVLVNSFRKPLYCNFHTCFWFLLMVTKIINRL